jgi:hypothetical protein
MHQLEIHLGEYNFFHNVESSEYFFFFLNWEAIEGMFIKQSLEDAESRAEK